MILFQYVGHVQLSSIFSWLPSYPAADNWAPSTSAAWKTWLWQAPEGLSQRNDFRDKDGDFCCHPGMCRLASHFQDNVGDLGRSIWSHIHLCQWSAVYSWRKNPLEDVTGHPNTNFKIAKWHWYSGWKLVNKWNSYLMRKGFIILIGRGPSCNAKRKGLKGQDLTHFVGIVRANFET